MPRTPHGDKLLAAIENSKSKNDVPLLKEAMDAYDNWIRQLERVDSTGKEKVIELTALLNSYKDYLEVELIARRGSPFLKRQKGQLKLDNSIMEEFLIRLVDPSILNDLPDFDLEVGPHNAFMTLSFRPASISGLNDVPEVVIKSKDQDFTIGKTIHYKFSTDSKFTTPQTSEGELYLSVLSAEVKVNLDKTMFQECCGTASRLKRGCPSAKYFVLVEFLDMEPEDSRLTDVDNVFLLRHAKRLASNKRSIYEEVRDQHREFPIDGEVIYRFTQEVNNFIEAVWHDPSEALKRGSFV